MAVEDLDFDPFEQELDSSAESPEDLRKSGNILDVEGTFHVEISKVDWSFEKDKCPHFIATMTVLNGTVPEQENKSTKCRVFLGSKDDNGKYGPMNENAKNNLLWFLYSFGVIGNENLGKDAKPIKLSQDLISRLENTHGFAKVSAETYTDKTGAEKTTHRVAWGSDCWPISHEEVKDVPRDHEALAMIGISAATAEDLDDI